MSVDWDAIYRKRGLYSGHGSRGRGAALKLQAIKYALEQLHAKSVLDVGCGDLHVMNQVDLNELHYTGVDRSTVLLELVADAAHEKQLVHADFLTWSPRQTFDLVVCFDVLIHLDDADDFWRFTDKLLAISDKGLLVSGYLQESDSIRNSHVVFFHVPLAEAFADCRSTVLGEYNQTSILFVRLQ